MKNFLAERVDETCLQWYAMEWRSRAVICCTAGSSRETCLFTAGAQNVNQ